VVTVVRAEAAVGAVEHRCLASLTLEVVKPDWAASCRGTVENRVTVWYKGGTN